MRSGNWEKLGPVLERVLTAMNLGREVREWQALGRWGEAAGEKMASRCTAERIQDGVLWIRAAGPQWAAEVSLRKQEIMDRLNEAAGDKIVKDIRFVGAWKGSKR